VNSLGDFTATHSLNFSVPTANFVKALAAAISGVSPGTSDIQDILDAANAKKSA
jgi:hypothetical protein